MIITTYQLLKILITSIRTYAPEELMRLRKSVGGIVEGEDNVPFTKEDPADRVDPFNW